MSQALRHRRADEERELAARARAGDVDARATLIEGLLPLVGWVAREFRGRGLDRDDLFGVGVVALVEAVDRYDPVRGTRASTYVVPRIRDRIRNALVSEYRDSRPDRRGPSKVVSPRGPGIWPRMKDGRWEAITIVNGRPYVAAICRDRAAAAAAYDRATAALARGRAGA